MAFLDTARAYPTLLRIGFAEMVAYRAEMIVWMLSTTMPLVNLALWHSIAASGSIGGYGQRDLVAYFLSAFIVRQITGSWVVWEMNQEMRSGRFSMRLLRPIHPLVAYSAENLAALPLRGVLSLPIAAVALFAAGATHFAQRPPLWPCIALSLLGAWLITFLCMAMVGSLGFFLEQSGSLMYVWLALFYGLSGYFFPLDFLEAKLPGANHVLHLLPFYYQTGFPIELLLGRRGLAEALGGLAVQWAYVVALLGLTLLVWRAGVRRWNAYGA